MRIGTLIAVSAFALASTVLAARIDLVAGGGINESDAPATECKLHEPFGVEFLPGGEMVIVEMSRGNRVVKVDVSGKLSQIAGKGTKGFSGDGGPARDAEFNGIHNL